MIRHALAGALAIVCATPSLAAIQAPSHCIDVSVPKSAVAARSGKWTELTKEQWLFLSGIYAMNPETPAGLPHGDKAVLAQVDGNAGGLVFFIDGDKACTPMPVPKPLVDMLHDVATGEINHEAPGL